MTRESVKTATKQQLEAMRAEKGKEELRAQKLNVLIEEEAAKVPHYFHDK